MGFEYALKHSYTSPQLCTGTGNVVNGANRAFSISAQEYWQLCLPLTHFPLWIRMRTRERERKEGCNERRRGGVKEWEAAKEGVRSDEKAAAEPALATQSLTRLFIVQWDASSLSHNSFFFFIYVKFPPFYLFVCIFRGGGRERLCVFVCVRERENVMQLWFLEGSPQVEDEVTVSFFNGNAISAPLW